MTAVIESQVARSPRVPPHSIDAEESVLGSVLLSADAANIALERLHAEDFYKPSHQRMFEVIQALFDSNEPIDAITVSEGLRRDGSLDRMGGIEALTNLIDSVPTTSNAEYYAGIVEEHSLRRRLMRVGGEIGVIAGHMTDPIEEVVDKSEQAVFAVAERQVGDGLQVIDDLLGPAIEKAEELQRNGSEVTGISTGFRDLDRKLAGLHPTNLVIVAARPGMGKTALALNVAQNVALAGNTVAIFSLEMSREEVVTRMLCAKGRIDSQRLRTGRLAEADFTKLSNAAGDLYKQNIFVDDSPGLTVTEIRAKCRRLRRRPGLDLVVVDYLQLMNGSGQENRQQEIAMISRSLKSLARELNLPIIALSQLNRGVEAREDKRPRLGDLRESGAVEQDADVVMFIYRDEYYYPEKVESKGVAEVVVAKHRQGSVGKVDMTFLPEFTLFADMGRSEAPM
ncbi:MAG: replicative DNA helicase [Acidimicrobiia bacterium]